MLCFSMGFRGEMDDDPETEFENFWPRMNTDETQRGIAATQSGSFLPPCGGGVRWGDWAAPHPALPPRGGEGNPQFHRSATATSRKSCRNCFTLHDCSTDCWRPPQRTPTRLNRFSEGKPPALAVPKQGYPCPSVFIRGFFRSFLWDAYESSLYLRYD